ncbi:nuclease-related domain-containing protein [Lentibacillus jeotgali]|uniref:nuclease-related domain-containing protein n=1 Tax=Lentibacillus jeotgali TaxID=558169 RepID=UPI00026260B1|nr:NERD domain-containing protein [Lentibacillus jeotgali]
MKIKNRSKPLPLRKLDVIIPRLSSQFPRFTEIKEDAKRQGRGYSGEMKVDYYLESLASRYTLLDDVYLHINGKNFQIDSLVVANHAIFIVDAKHYMGTITFDPILKQLIRNDGNIESGFEYPITQVENQKFHLHNWLLKHKLAHIPIYYFIAVADPSTIIKVDGNREEISKVVAHASRVPGMIMEKDQELAQAGKAKIQDYKVGKMILRECGVYDMNIMKQYGITCGELLPGVFCPECGMRGMKRIHGGWICKNCRQKSHNAHLKDIYGYVLLNGSITNTECMWFLGLTSRSTATRILQKSDLIYLKKYKYWVKNPKTC